VQRLLGATAATAAAFAALAGLVVSGALDAVDGYAVQHWMPYLTPSDASGSTVSARGLGLPSFGRPLEAFCNLRTFPASVVVSGLLLALGCIVLARRGERSAAVAWAGAWIGANLIELLGKGLLERPTLYVDGLPARGFSNSFPSGHTVRAVVVGAMLVAIWRRLALPIAIWIAVSLPALVVSAAHTPSDVAGGLLLAAFAICVSQLWLLARETGRRARVGLRAVAEEP
jgi:membrane-associated phospholipid phosphatase